MLSAQLRDLYQNYLCSRDAPVKMRVQVLRNLHTYLVEEEIRMMKAEDECKCLRTPSKKMAGKLLVAAFVKINFLKFAYKEKHEIYHG